MNEARIAALDEIISVTASKLRKAREEHDKVINPLQKEQKVAREEKAILSCPLNIGDTFEEVYARRSSDLPKIRTWKVKRIKPPQLREEGFCIVCISILKSGKEGEQTATFDETEQSFNRRFKNVVKANADSTV
jgi:hypothetical protein